MEEQKEIQETKKKPIFEFALPRLAKRNKELEKLLFKNGKQLKTYRDMKPSHLDDSRLQSPRHINYRALYNGGRNQKDGVTNPTRMVNSMKSLYPLVNLELEKATQVEMVALRFFMYSLVVNKMDIRKGILFLKPHNVDDYKTVSNKVAEVYIKDRIIEPNYMTTTIGINGAAGELIGNQLTLDHLTVFDPKFFKATYHTINMENNLNQIVLPEMVNAGLIDDEIYLIYKAILSKFYIIYDIRFNKIVLYPKAMTELYDKYFKLGKSYEEIEELKRIQTSISRNKLTRLGVDHKGNQIEINRVENNELLQKEIDLGYVNKTIGDKKNNFAYSHILRSQLDFKLQKWQRNFMFDWKQYNFIAASRRAGKTFLSAFIGLRELYREGSGFGNRNRQVLYVTLNEIKAWQPFQYMMQMTEAHRERGFITVNLQRKEFTCTLTKTKLLFITAGARGGAASYGADMVIVDEAAMIPNDFWDDLVPIIVQERATVVAISTINESSRKNWFYKYLLNGEGGDENINTIRCTIDDNELIDNESKKELKKQLKDNQMKYWTQLYSIFPSGSTIFNLNGVIQAVSKSPLIQRPIILIGYDPAKLGDNASFVVVDPQTFEVIDEHTLRGVDYTDQKKFLEDIILGYKQNGSKVVVTMDRSGVGEAVSEIFGDIITYSVKYKAAGNITVDTLYGYYKVAKGDLIDTLKIYFSDLGLTISDDLTNLLNELKGFKVLKSKGIALQYGGVGITDDSVNALALVTFTMKNILYIEKKFNLTNIKGVDQTEMIQLENGQMIDIGGGPFANYSYNNYVGGYTSNTTNNSTNLMEEYTY